MNNRSFVIAAVALGLVAALLNYVYLSSAQAAGLTVLRVRKDQAVRAGQLASPDSFEPVTIYGDLGQLRNLVVTDADFGNFLQQPLTESLEPGDLLFLKSFNIQGDKGVRAELQAGERALTLQISDEAKAAGYFVRPGDVVDIWGSMTGQAMLLKERARIIAVGETYKLASEAKGEDRSFRTITVVVPETDISPLLTNVALAANDVTLSLVGPEDSKREPKPAMQAMAGPIVAPKAGPKEDRTMIMPGTQKPAPAPAPAPAPTTAPAPATAPPTTAPR